MPNPAAIAEAAARLAPHIRRTPLLNLDAAELGVPVSLKLEFLQHGGSFKARGAFNRLLTAETEPGAGVVAASGGNHGAAVAYAARALGLAATIFVPEPTPPAKLSRIAAYGATVMRGGANYAEALERSRAWGLSRGALDVHAYDHPAVLAGQGTIGLELAADDPALTHVLVAVGGGGLVGGIAGFYAGSGTAVVAVEPASCPTLATALTRGEPTDVAVGGIAADSLGARRIGAATFALAERTRMAVVPVSDDSIRAAQAWLWDRLRIVAEPGGACALAPLLDGTWSPPPGARVAVVLCGANCDPGTLSKP